MCRKCQTASIQISPPYSLLSDHLWELHPPSLVLRWNIPVKGCCACGVGASLWLCSFCSRLAECCWSRGRGWKAEETMGWREVLRYSHSIPSRTLYHPHAIISRVGTPEEMESAGQMWYLLTVLLLVGCWVLGSGVWEGAIGKIEGRVLPRILVCMGVCIRGIWVARIYGYSFSAEVPKWEAHLYFRFYKALRLNLVIIES